MIMVSTKTLSSEQVNDIILLVNENSGKVFMGNKKKALKIDLSLKTTEEKVEIVKQIRRVKEREKI